MTIITTLIGIITTGDTALITIIIITITLITTIRIIVVIMMVITMIIITALVITEHLRKLTEEVTQMKSTEEMITPTVVEPTRLTMVLTDLPTGEIKVLMWTATNSRTTLGEAILHQAMEETVVVPLLEMVVLEEDQTGKI